MTSALTVLDDERCSSGEPSENGDLFREWSADRSECRVVFVVAKEAGVAAMVEREMWLAEAAGYGLEWKTYAHDKQADVEAALIRCGFEAEPIEAVLVRTDPIAQAGLLPDHRLRVVADSDADLSDIVDIWTATGRGNIDTATDALRAQLDAGTVTTHVAYVDDVPASCGRLLRGTTQGFAELAGGVSKREFRRRGLYTALVSSRLTAAFARGDTHVFVDALPTSAPILGRLGFRAVTQTTPYTYSPK
ncbi:GNAT family N-acetyltransferase [Rhodococcus marinonascens]|uniref:GNAT family N-acetyltransferase n=1 Tax=Rhodococcus marinonascens TaxID=38311 RepID=UPI000A0628A0|nr:GNAT family N-acetyltransferase [Rhodococcus marinonascens]